MNSQRESEDLVVEIDEINNAISKIDKILKDGE